MHRETSDFELSFFEKLVRSKPNYVDALIPLAETYTKRGLYQKGLEVDRHLARLRKKDPIIHYNLACSLALVGCREEAVKTLQVAIGLGYHEFDHMRHDQDLRGLHGDPQFEALFKVKSKKVSRPLKTKKHGS